MILFVTAAIACSSGGVPIEERMAEARYGFQGRVVSRALLPHDSTREHGPHVRLEVEVRHVWKGAVGRTVTVYQRINSSSSVIRLGEELVITADSPTPGLHGFLQRMLVMRGTTPSALGPARESYALLAGPADHFARAIATCDGAGIERGLALELRTVDLGGLSACRL